MCRFGRCLPPPQPLYPVVFVTSRTLCRRSSCAEGRLAQLDQVVDRPLFANKQQQQSLEGHTALLCWLAADQLVGET